MACYVVLEDESAVSMGDIIDWALGALRRFPEESPGLVLEEPAANAAHRGLCALAQALQRQQEDKRHVGQHIVALLAEMDRIGGRQRAGYLATLQTVLVESTLMLVGPGGEEEFLADFFRVTLDDIREIRLRRSEPQGTA